VVRKKRKRKKKKSDLVKLKKSKKKKRQICEGKRQTGFFRCLETLGEKGVRVIIKRGVEEEKRSTEPDEGAKTTTGKEFPNPFLGKKMSEGESELKKRNDKIKKRT